MNNADEPALWMKFVGEGLDIHSIPIYELGDCLIAVQRIVHKAYLASGDRKLKYAHLTPDERKRLSLQIRDHRKSSDLYGLIPFATDPAIQQHVFDLLKSGLGSLAKYALKSVFAQKAEKAGVSQNIQEMSGSALTGNIYAETVAITNHIYNIGNVERIDLILGNPQDKPIVSLDKSVQEYVRELRSQKFYGERTEITGFLRKLLSHSFTAEIKIGPKRYVKVILSDTDFDFVRYQTKRGDQLLVKGRPVVRLDKTEDSFDEFEGDAISVVDSDP